MLFLILGEYPSLGPDVDRSPPLLKALSLRPDEEDGLLFGLRRQMYDNFVKKVDNKNVLPAEYSFQSFRFGLRFVGLHSKC